MKRGLSEKAIREIERKELSPWESDGNGETVIS